MSHVATCPHWVNRWVPVLPTSLNHNAMDDGDNEVSNPNLQDILSHWGWDKMAAISLTTFSNAFSWIKMYEFSLRFHWNLFLRVQFTGDKPLSEPMMVNLLTHLCVTQPQCVNNIGDGHGVLNFCILHIEHYTNNESSKTLWCQWQQFVKKICANEDKQVNYDK